MTTWYSPLDTQQNDGTQRIQNDLDSLSGIVTKWTVTGCSRDKQLDTINFRNNRWKSPSRKSSKNRLLDKNSCTILWAYMSTSQIGGFTQESVAIPWKLCQTSAGTFHTYLKVQFYLISCCTRIRCSKPSVNSIWKPTKRYVQNSRIIRSEQNFSHWLKNINRYDPIFQFFFRSDRSKKKIKDKCRKLQEQIPYFFSKTMIEADWIFLYET